MRFLDLFAGIGGFRLGMTMAGHECVGYVEWNEFARQSYAAIHDAEGEWTASDITRVSDDDIRELGSECGPIHVICGGFPCQSFSIAGKQGGFNDTRGTLFFEIMRFASILRPRYLFLENVEGLLSHNDGDTFETILRTLDEVGYDAEWDVPNSKDFRVPQNRNRVFIIGHLRGQRSNKIFPIGFKNKNTIRIVGVLGEGFRAVNEVLDPYGLSTCLLTMTGGNRQPKILIGNKVRKLTPRECWRLQGFPDWAFDRAAEVNSNSQLYKQAGNSVTVNVIYEIAKRLA